MFMLDAHPKDPGNAVCLDHLPAMRVSQWVTAAWPCPDSWLLMPHAAVVCAAALCSYFRQNQTNYYFLFLSTNQTLLLVTPSRSLSVC